MYINKQSAGLSLKFIAESNVSKTAPWKRHETKQDDLSGHISRQLISIATAHATSENRGEERRWK